VHILYIDGYDNNKSIKKNVIKFISKTNNVKCVMNFKDKFMKIVQFYIKCMKCIIYFLNYEYGS